MAASIGRKTVGVSRGLARQLPDGQWTSKLGQIIDIEHKLSAVEGPNYGKVSAIVARISNSK